MCISSVCVCVPIINISSYTIMADVFQLMVRFSVYHRVLNQSLIWVISSNPTPSQLCVITILHPAHRCNIGDALCSVKFDV